ncbi:hypothetical protein B9Z55_021056 [Caenorhabditis nigoni]|uniref:Lin-15A/B-like domain-containing protein n=1 Tax=Caenorhabditis nigoni TaxID=1611254 RepID=A0A2G5TQI6_9PELO|nr:hypothetical protein B9Z55_021056 [Caenorhabditis nigoni]
MNEGVVKEEVIEETCNFTFKNGEYVEVKQEEIDYKPENLLEQDIKTEMDYFEDSDELCEDVELKPKESDSEFEKVSTEFTTLQCKICQKRMPRSLLKMIKSEDDMIVLTVIFEVEVINEMDMTYVCLSHIQAIIDDKEGRMKFKRTSLEENLRPFIAKNKSLIRGRTLQSGFCKICHKLKNRSETYTISSKNIRIVLMTGCILRGTHSIDQAKSYITNSSMLTCYSHRKESIDMIFEYLGISNIQEFLLCPRLSMGGLVKIAKNFDSKFTVDQFIRAFKTLFWRKPKVVPCNL